MKSGTFDGKDGLHTAIDPSSSEAMRDDPNLKSMHKIFLSHSGVQNEFVEHLCKALEERCHYPFFDRHPESLPKGKEFLGVILEAIQQCQLFVVVISEEYFLSKWCMIELNAFMKAKKEMKSNMNVGVLPLFYGLFVGELRDEWKRQRWFARWEEFARNDPKRLVKVDDWKYALDELIKFNGLPYDRELKQVVEYENEVMSIICKLVTPDFMWDDSHVQGNAHEAIIEKMKQVKVVGLYGVGGIGKTTACMTLCNKLSSDFEGRVCHIEFGRAPFKELLQKVVIQLTKKSQDFIQHLNEGECYNILYKNLMKQKTFLAIDNVFDNATSIEQAMVFLKAPSHEDSLVLVTAQAQRTLELLGIDGISCLEMPELGQGDATNLFLYHATNGQHFTSDEDMSYIDLCVKKCCFSKSDRGGLYYHPLTLKVLGSQLGWLGKNPFEWARVLSSVQNFNTFSGEDEIFNILRSGFDQLRPIETFTSQQALVKEISDLASDKKARTQGMEDFEESDLASNKKARTQGMEDFEDLPVFRPSAQSHSLTTDTPPLSPSILVEGDMPSTSFGKGPFSLSEVPTADLVHCTDKLHSYLDIAAQCLVHVQEMPSRNFNNEQCGYLVAKLQVILQRATSFLVNVQFSAAEDMKRCTEVFKLLLALALKIESFIQGCCKDEWLPAAVTLTNTFEYVSSLGFDLELCRTYFSIGWTTTKALTAAEVDNIDREELEIVKRKASLDVDVLLNKVILKLSSLQAEQKDLAIYLLQRLRGVRPVSNSLLPESSFGSAFDDQGFLGRMFRYVHEKKKNNNNNKKQKLGKGTFATVYKALWLGIPVAKKTFDCPGHPDYVKEVQILGRLSS